MVLTYDAYNETIQEQKEKEDKLKRMEERFDVIQSMMEKLIVGLFTTTDQQQLNTIAKTIFSSGILKMLKESEANI